MTPNYFIYRKRRVAIYSRGDIRQNPLIFLHGNSLGALSFKPQFEGIQGIPMIALDFPGHGNSERAEDAAATYCLEGLSALIDDLKSHVGFDSYILCGHSLGGHVAIEKMSRDSCCKGIFISGAPAIGLPAALNEAFLPHPAMPLLFKADLEAGELQDLAGAMAEPSAWEIRKTLVDWIKDTDPLFRQCIGASVAAGRHGDEVEMLRKAGVPVAIVHGYDDPLVNHAYIEKLDIPTLWKKSIQFLETGHCVSMEGPGSYKRLLTEFYHSIKSPIALHA